jgi:hypothetical protein
MRRMLCVLTIAAIVLIGTVAAAPPLPQEFYGSVFLNGNPAPVGTVIIAKINGETRGTFITTETGVYGGAGNFDPRLRVNATEEELSAGNTTITFIVGGVQAFQIVTFKSGSPENTKLDLLANIRAFGTDTTVIPTYSSGGTSGGSVSPASGTGTGTTSGSAIPGSAVISPAPTESRSSIYYNIDDQQTIPATTIIATTAATPSPAITTVPTTKKAGVGPLSVVFLVVSLIALLCVVGRADDTRKRR